MGYEFDDNGKYIGWSDIFDYSGIEELKASEYLPIPTGTKYEYKTLEDINKEIQSIQEQINASEDENEKQDLSYRLKALQKLQPFDISEKLRQIASKMDEIQTVWEQINSTEDQVELQRLNKLFHTLKAQRIKQLAFLLRELSEQKKTAVKGTNYTYLTWDEGIQHADEILAEINKHSTTVISPEKLEKCLKNAVASSITNIIQNPRNMDQAYSPIEMRTVRGASEQSPKGSKSERMTLLNPLTKFLMQEQNMVGKGVIGITAVGEKVFFNVSYYWNEGLRSGDAKWLYNLHFSQKFNRIEGRSKDPKNLTTLQSVTKTQLANVNFEEVSEDIRKAFVNLDKVIPELRRKWSITDEDLLNKTGNYAQYKQELLDYVRSQQDYDTYADDLISQLLSAATDFRRLKIYVHK